MKLFRFGKTSEGTRTYTPKNEEPLIRTEPDEPREPTISKSITGTLVFALLFVLSCAFFGIFFGKAVGYIALTACLFMSIMPIYYAYKKQVNGIWLTKRHQHILYVEGAIKVSICLIVLYGIYALL